MHDFDGIKLIEESDENILLALHAPTSHVTF